MNGLPFENLPASPESIFQQEYKSGQQQIQQQFKLQWDEINRRARSFGSPAQHKQALNDLYTKGQQAMLRFNQEMQQRSDQLKQVDQLAKQGAIQNPDEVKWRMTVGPEVAGKMFPRRADPRTEYHANLRLRRELMSDIASYQLDSKGRLYVVDPGTGKIDKKIPASEVEYRGWLNSIAALESAEKYKQEQIMPRLTTADIASTRLQELLLGQQEKKVRGWLSRFFLPHTAKEMRSLYGFPEPARRGTFANKVSATMGQPITESRVRGPEQKITRKQLLTEYKRLGGGQTTEGRTFADQYLR